MGNASTACQPQGHINGISNGTQPAPERGVFGAVGVPWALRTMSSKEDETVAKVYTCLWFDGQAEEAASFYTSLIPNSRVHVEPRRDGECDMTDWTLSLLSAPVLTAT